MKCNVLTLSVFMLTAVFFTNCNTESKKITFKNGKSYQTQTVYGNEKIAESNGDGVAFYLPKQYDGKKALPVVYLIDPHAEGVKPIELYKQAADQLGYILIASNTLQNGLSHSESLVIFSRLKAYVQSAFVYDAKRQFTSGFSGGAKLAMMFAFDDPSIIGTITCGGTLPIAGASKPTFYYAGIVGNTDFNYLECRQSFSVFESYGYDYTALVFNGGHQWPPLSYFIKALQGLDVYCMKMKLIPVDDKKLEALFKASTDSVTLYREQNLALEQFEQLQQINRWFYGLQPITEIKKEIIELQNSPQFGNQLQNRQKAIQKEVTLRTQFVRAISLNDLTWWKTEIDNFNTFDSKNADLVVVKKRLLNYLSMVSYSLIKSDLDALNMTDVEKKLAIYELVDPTNYDVYLMRARYYMLINQPDEMKIYYQKAVDLGFNAVARYANDQAWRPLMQKMNVI